VIALVAACSPVEPRLGPSLDADSPSAATQRASIALAERWLRSVSEYQAMVLEDRRVTVAEYEQAVDSTAACLNRKGYETGPVREVPDGVRLDFMVIQGDNDASDVAAAWSTCWIGYLRAVESVYLAQHARLDTVASRNCWKSVDSRGSSAQQDTDL